MRELKVLTGQPVVIASEATTLRGVLESATRTFVTLIDAVDVDGPTPTPIAGKVLIPAARINYVQAVV